MLILVTDPAGTHHRPGAHHPERPERLEAVLAAADRPEFSGGIERCEPRAATEAELLAVHTPHMLARVEAVRGRHAQLDGDTTVSPESVEIAWRAAGSGLTAVDALDASGEGTAFCAVRPPGHHATSATSMGFCLFNNVAVTAAALVARGERVLIADFDAHHGNGTQDIFYDDPGVLFVSWHQSPLYPGTGSLDEIGGPRAPGRTVNIPLVPDSTGDSYLATLDGVVGGIIDGFDPTWLLISAGFDAHRRDPLTDMGLTSGDYAELVAALMTAVPDGRTIAFLEGGYDLDALRWSTEATLGALLGLRVHPEPPSAGGSGSGRLGTIVDAVATAQGLR